MQFVLVHPLRTEYLIDVLSVHHVPYLTRYARYTHRLLPLTLVAFNVDNILTHNHRSDGDCWTSGPSLCRSATLDNQGLCPLKARFPSPCSTQSITRWLEYGQSRDYPALGFLLISAQYPLQTTGCASCYMGARCESERRLKGVRSFLLFSRKSFDMFKENIFA